MPVRKAAELQVLSADCELRAKVKAWVCLGSLLAGSGLVRLDWAPKSSRPLLPGDPRQNSAGTQEQEWGRRREF